MSHPKYDVQYAYHLESFHFSILLIQKRLIFIIYLGLVKGLNQVGKALDRKDAYLCILAKDCDDPKYKKLITALAKQNKIPLIEIDSRTDLGMWLGQCKYDKDGVPRKTKGASSCAIKDYGETSDALSFLEQYIKEHDL
jgi:small subunit ribosomal protein S12e